MEKGKIIFLNGVTSSGKTSIVEEMQAQKDKFLYVVANDLFQEMVGDEYLKEDYWKYLSDIIIMMYRTARMFSDYGKDIIIDGIIVERLEISPHYEKILQIFEGYCPLEICRKRNIDRGDRYETQSEEQASMMTKNIRYSFRVDTSVHPSKECADMILEHIYG